MYGTAMMGLLGGSGNGSLFKVTPYTGNGSTQSIVTGQNTVVSSLIWAHPTSTAGYNHSIIDSVRGVQNTLNANDTSAETVTSGSVTAFNNNGFTVGNSAEWNLNAASIIAFSWLEQAGYFDVAGWTGNDTNRTITVNGTTKLALVKRRSGTSTGWRVYHSSLGNTKYLELNSGEPSASSSSMWNSTSPTSTTFALGTSSDVNASGDTYIGYFFQESAGNSKFGTYSGTTTINTGLASISAFLVKRTDDVGDWYFFYNNGGTWYHVKPNSTAARATGLISVSSGDVTLSGAASSGNGIYAAWR